MQATCFLDAQSLSDSPSNLPSNTIFLAKGNINSVFSISKPGAPYTGIGFDQIRETGLSEQINSSDLFLIKAKDHFLDINDGIISSAIFSNV